MALFIPISSAAPATNKSRHLRVVILRFQLGFEDREPVSRNLEYESRRKLNPLEANFPKVVGGFFVSQCQSTEIFNAVSCDYRFPSFHILLIASERVALWKGRVEGDNKRACVCPEEEKEGLNLTTAPRVLVCVVADWLS